QNAAEARREKKEADDQRGRADRETAWANRNYRRVITAYDKLLTHASEDRDRLRDQPGMTGMRRRLLEDALALWAAFLREKSDAPHIRFQTAGAQHRIGDIQHKLGRHAEAEKAYGAAIALLEPLVRASPADPHYRLALASSYGNRGFLHTE